MEIYKKLQSQYESELKIIKKKYNLISSSRLICIILFLFLGYYFFKTENNIFLYFSLFSFAVFLFLIKFHNKISNQKKLKEAIITINKDEISFLNRERNSFENGIEFNDFNHTYAFDLDIFGENSIFQYLNRTYTFIGKNTLANLLKNILPQQRIFQQQIAIQELSKNIDFRQDFMASALIANDSENVYKRLLGWAKSKSGSISKAMKFFKYALPVVFVLLIITYFRTHNSLILSWISFLFIVNMSILGIFYKKISIEIQYISEIELTIKNYGLLIEKIEKQTFKSEKLIELQKLLLYESTNASKHFEKLAMIFSNMDTLHNIVTTILFNGTFLFHIHVFDQLLTWKKNQAQHLENWLKTIGEFESLISLANFSYNNPSFVFPEINNKFQISFENLIHPLINSEKRIENSIDFQTQNFFILTGSNMSGKSTFLRSLGLNMILAGTGSVVCATKASVHTMPILVAMRTSDSLAESESYFYAEIKRLKTIMDSLDSQKCFVLLDEILRGTNSDDKQMGTIAIVEKMISKSAIGVIATHDIEVCLTTEKYPNILANKCFEAQIINDDLLFDYKLRDGICKNKSATFLMKKLDII